MSDVIRNVLLCMSAVLIGVAGVTGSAWALLTGMFFGAICLVEWEDMQ